MLKHTHFCTYVKLCCWRYRWWWYRIWWWWSLWWCFAFCISYIVLKTHFKRNVFSLIFVVRFCPNKLNRKTADILTSTYNWLRFPARNKTTSKHPLTTNCKSGLAPSAKQGILISQSPNPSIEIYYFYVNFISLLTDRHIPWCMIIYDSSSYLNIL